MTNTGKIGRESSLRNQRNEYGHWDIPKQFNPDDWVGFVYRIRNIDSEKFYFGKKNFKSNRRIKVKGRINRKLKTTESNWKTYNSSCKSLHEDIEKLGEDKFKFEILSLHQTKSSLAYAEVKAIMDNDCLLKEECYNQICPPLKYRIVITEKEREFNETKSIN